ncbi:gliding motility-associated C-terminal domain-containing protein [Gilvibacter sp.]|uniref:T9SS type B sorting domain-containing protein n=1 Tax=Gilvibacter sp. TaxID=2729997 RepID=UPI0025C38AB3|nr:gliding motility-associated C-terminal domain-containing protein [Gilvibacter sp.]NQX78410.1 gliding motility-associated C-terminal domain-containing protein [Gilvibacter sp.]
MKTKLLLFVLGLLSCTTFGQEINMQNGSFNVCTGNFYDSGGPAAPYANNETLVLTLCDDGSGGILQVDFTSFTTETPNDVLTIYDGADTSAPVIGDFSGTNSPGIVRPSPTNPSGCLTFEFVSNEFFTSIGWEAQISCCQEISTTFDGSTPAAVGGIIEADVDEVITVNASAVFADSDAGATYEWDFGDGTVMSGLSAMHAYTSPGLYPISFTATDAAGCVDQTRIELTADVEFDVSVGNPFVDAGPDVTLDCSSGEICADLSADFLSIGETTTYNVVPIPFDPPFSFNGLANSLNPDIDDAWSDVEELPFDFCFFGGTETQFQVGSNGVIRFEVDGSDTSNGWSFDEDLPNNDNPTLGEANIFTPGHDINPATSDFEEIGYEVLGTAPNRVLVVSYFEVPMFSGSCTDLLATQMAVLYETTNIIDVYILNKPTCETWNDGNAVLGIQNNEGTEAFVPPGRNTSDSPWTTEFEAWRFIPDGPSVTSITWLDESGDVVGDTADITVCPVGTQTYTARVDYLNCNGETVTVEDTVTVTSNATFSFNLGDDIGTCDTDPITLDADTGAAGVTYQWFLDDAPIVGATDPTYDATTTGSYRCEATDGDCTVADTVVVTFFDTPMANTPTDLTVCDDDNDGFAEFDLTLADAEIIAGQPDTFVTYYVSEADALAGVAGTELIMPYTNTENPQVVWARIENSGGCFDIVSFTITVLNSPEINDPIANYELCDDEVADGITVFDLTFWISEITAESAVDISFHETEAEADAGTGAIADPTAYSNVVNPQLIWVRIVNPTTGCFTVGSFTITVNEGPTTTAPEAYELCDMLPFDGIEPFDLTSRDAEITGGVAGVTVNYYLTAADAASGDTSLALSSPYLNVANPQDVFARVEDDTTGCFSIESLTLIVLDGPVIADPSPLALCDSNNPGDEIEEFDLTLKDNEITLGDASLVVTYHETEVDSQTGDNPLSSPYTNTSNPQTIYVRVVDPATGCFSLTTLELEIIPLVPFNIPEPVVACGDSGGFATFDLEALIEVITGGELGIIVSFHATDADAQNNVNPLPLSYTNTTNPEIIYVRVTDPLCFATFPLELIAEASPSLNTLEPIELCADAGSGTAAYDLNQLEALLGIETSGLEVTYHTSNEDAQNGENPIASPETYQAADGDTVYIRAETAATCEAIAVVEFVVEVCEIVIPQGISPNADGFNDTLDISGLALHSNYDLKIYDRRGILVYSGNASTSNWDGTAVEANGELLPVGTYFYVLQLNDAPGDGRFEDTQQLYNGWIYLNY